MKLKQILKKIIPVSRFAYQSLKEEVEILKQDLGALKKECEVLKQDYERMDVKFTDVIRKNAEDYNNV